MHPKRTRRAPSCRGHLVLAVFRGACVALFLTLTTPALAGGFHITVMGVRRTGMMTVVANPDDATALFINPAGLVLQPGTRVHVSSGVTFLDSSARLAALDEQRFPEVNATADGSCTDPRADPSCPWPVDAEGYYIETIGPERYFGLIPFAGWTTELGSWGPHMKDVVAGVAVYAPGAYGAFLPEDAPSAYYVMDGLFLNLAATGGVGLRITDTLAVGASASYNYRRLGFRQKFSLMDLLTPTGEAPPFEASLAQVAVGDLVLDYAGVDHGLGWGVGLLWTPTRALQLGASIVGFTNASFSGDVEFSATGSALGDEQPRGPAELRELVQGLDLKLPRSLDVDMAIPPLVALGASVTVSPRLEIAAEGRIYWYSLYDEQRIVPRYAADEPGDEPLTAADLTADKQYANSWEVSLGVRGQPFASVQRLELMGGISFDKSPVPDATWSLDNPSMDQLVFSLGARWSFGAGFRAGVAYMLTRYIERDIRTSETSPPTNLVISSWGHIPTVELAYAY